MSPGGGRRHDEAPGHRPVAGPKHRLGRRHQLQVRVLGAAERENPPRLSLGDADPERGREAGAGDGRLWPAVHAADPEPGAALAPRLLHDEEEQATKEPAQTLSWESHAVPDIGLPRSRRNLEPQLADPLGTGGEPAIAGDLAGQADREAAATAGKTERDQVA